MRWSFKVGEFAGIGVYIHATFLLLLGWIGITHWQERPNLLYVLSGIIFILALFICVLLHEFGHALTAKRYGIKTRDITLLPIGGLARLERMPDDPIEELWVALAGPAVNVVIAGILIGLLFLTGTYVPINHLTITNGSMLERLMIVNLFLVLFNMLPAFPMDGGRVVRALLAIRMDYVKATNIASYLGQGMAFLFGIVGFYGNFFLIFIAIFVWMGASQEAGMVQMKAALGGIPVSHAMITDFKTLLPQDSLGHAIEMVLAGSQHDFPIVENEKIVGILTRENLLRALHEKGKETPIQEVMQTDFQVADSSETLETAFRRLRECDCQTLPVLRDGNLTGLLTTENVGEYVMIQSAMGNIRAGKLKA